MIYERKILLDFVDLFFELIHLLFYHHFDLFLTALNEGINFNLNIFFINTSCAMMPHHHFVLIACHLDTQGFSAVRRPKILLRPFWHNARRIDVRMAVVVVAFDVFHVHRVSHPFHLIQFFHVVEDVAVIRNTLTVTLKVTHIHSIKTH